MSHTVGEGDGDVHEPGGVGRWVWGQKAGDGAVFGACEPGRGGGRRKPASDKPRKTQVMPSGGKTVLKMKNKQT